MNFGLTRKVDKKFLVRTPLSLTLFFSFRIFRLFRFSVGNISQGDIAEKSKRGLFPSSSISGKLWSFGPGAKGEGRGRDERGILSLSASGSKMAKLPATGIQSTELQNAAESHTKSSEIKATRLHPLRRGIPFNQRDSSLPSHRMGVESEQIH